MRISELTHEAATYATLAAFAADASTRRNAGWTLFAFDASNPAAILAVWELVTWIPTE